MKPSRHYVYLNYVQADSHEMDYGFQHADVEAETKQRLMETEEIQNQINKRHRQKSYGTHKRYVKTSPALLRKYWMKCWIRSMHKTATHFLELTTSIV